jgi:recombination protein RecT
MSKELQKIPPAARLDSLKAILDRGKGSLASVLPKHMSAERMAKLATVAASKDHKLLECDPMSVLRSLMDASQLGLEPFTPLQQCYIIPYWNGKKGVMEAQFQVGYRGLIELVRRSDKILSIEAHVVYENDEFECCLGLTSTLMHRPLWTGDRGAMKMVYAVAKLKDGACQFEVMGKNDVDAIRGRSKSANSGPWVTDYDQMAKKTVIRRLIKYLPISIEAARAVAIEDKHDGFDSSSIVLDLDNEHEEQMQKIEAEVAPAIEAASQDKSITDYRNEIRQHIKDAKIADSVKSDLMNKLVLATDRKAIDQVAQMLALGTL